MSTTATYMTPHEVALRGFSALIHELGPGGAVQFINLYERGAGNYTEERKGILQGIVLDDIRNVLLPSPSPTGKH